MKKDSSTECWGSAEISDEWIRLASGNDARKDFIMPFTFKQLSDVSGKAILDLGCGEGGYSRELVRRGATVTSVDCAKKVIGYCELKAAEEGLNINHYVRNSCDLYGIANESFDIVLASMMLMDCEDFEGTVREITRVLKPSGKLFASVLHPCFAVNGDGIGRLDTGIDRKVLVSNYFHPKERAEPISKESEVSVIWRHRLIEDYVKVFIRCGLTITDLHEPVPTEEQARDSIMLNWLRKIPIFLFWELKK